MSVNEERIETNMTTLYITRKFNKHCVSLCSTTPLVQAESRENLCILILIGGKYLSDLLGRMLAQLVKYRRHQHSNEHSSRMKVQPTPLTSHDMDVSLIEPQISCIVDQELRVP